MTHSCENLVWLMPFDSLVNFVQAVVTTRRSARLFSMGFQFKNSLPRSKRSERRPMLRERGLIPHGPRIRDELIRISLRV